MTTLVQPDVIETQICMLDIGGMTCAACVRRIEKALSRVDGVVEASVNLATEAATVHYRPDQADVADLVGAVTRAGYTGTARPTASTSPSEPEAVPTGDTDEGAEREVAGLKRRWQVALVTGLTLMAVMYVP